MKEIITREAIYLWYYFDLQLRQIFWYWVLGMLLGSAISVFAKNYIHKAAEFLGKKIPGIVGLIFASLLGIASPLCMYGTIPICAAFSRKGVKDDFLAAFMMSSILLNPQLIIYSAALGPAMLAVRVVSCFFMGLAAGILVHFFYCRKASSVDLGTFSDVGAAVACGAGGLAKEATVCFGAGGSARKVADSCANGADSGKEIIRFAKNDGSTSCRLQEFSLRKNSQNSSYFTPTALSASSGKNKSISLGNGNKKSYFNFSSFDEPHNHDTDPNIFLRFVKNLWRNIKATGPMFLLGIALSAIFQRYVPSEAMAHLFGKGNEAFGLLMAATIGVPLYVCGGGTIPLLQQWLSEGMSAGSAAAFMLTGPSTKITNLGALKIALGIKNFALYIAFVILFSILTGFVVNLIL